MNESTETLTASGRAGAHTRADLIAAGRTLFGRRGFDGASIRAITGEAGANLGAVSYHFGSKRGLYAAVLEEGLGPLAANVTRAAASHGTAMDRVIRVVEAYFQHLEHYPDVPHLLLQEVAAGKRPPPVVLDIIAGVKATLIRLHAEGVEDGSIRPGHPLLTALSVISQPIYLALAGPLVKTVGGLDLTDPETRTMTLDHITAFVRAALEPRREDGP